MRRRRFLGLSTAAIAAGTALAGPPAPRSTPQQSGVRYLDQKRRAQAFPVGQIPGRRPNIFLITMDMVSADSYLPSRPLSRELELPPIRSLIGDSTFFRDAFATCAVDGANLALQPDHAELRGQMIGRLGAVRQKDPLWLGYWASFRLDHAAELPRVSGDMQPLQPR